MRKFIQNKLKEQKGLTLIELLAVIVILAIVAAIAIPAIGNIIENSRNGAVKSDYQNALAAANVYFTENPKGETPANATATVKVGTLLSQSYLDDKGSLSSDVVITKVAGGNTISGATEDTKYEIKAATPQTNAELSKIKNADFKGTDIKK
ncbi:prepilin-type N-terminal cleavage/methylation domain-containing protein [Paenisporosarcina sp. FSL H8-0542]|uniref:prepilin-type N-terminal cleavage/methylation domain-containing protein n=1 Tax=Paenisporosarcina sp. FSL H8-0542 TaxID=2921401 RepID=UPI00315A978F